MPLYTLGLWTAKPGHEDEFVGVWRDWATKTQTDFPGGTAILLRDRKDRRLFVSAGSWISLEQLEAWRNSDTFKDAVHRANALVDGFEPHTMDEVAVVL
jgi:heme-degrading monooxygenase HmoA